MKSAEKHFCSTSSQFWAKLSQKKIVLTRDENLRLLVKKMTADYKYSGSNRKNLLLPIQMQLSKKPKWFCSIFIAFLESTLNFEHFERKNEPHSLSISETIDSKRRGYLNV